MKSTRITFWITLILLAATTLFLAMAHYEPDHRTMIYFHYYSIGIVAGIASILMGLVYTSLWRNS